MSQPPGERIMDASALHQALERMAAEILAAHASNVEELGLVGIR